MNTTKLHGIHVRGISKTNSNTLKKVAKSKRLSVNGYILTLIDAGIKNFKETKKAEPSPVQKRIAELITQRYNDFKGRKMWPLKDVHNKMRAKISDEEYLEYLEKQLIDNPRPVYQIPESIK